ncbi:MAG: copper chaperone CopZ [Clostridia bacterium]
MQKVIIAVEGMSCGHCVAAVNKAVGSLAGVANVDVSLQAKTATVEFDAAIVSLDEIKEAIEDQGYDVK